MGRFVSMNFPLRRVICGYELRKTPLHNYQGERIDLSGLRFSPACVCSKLWFMLTGRRPAVPWLGYRAALRIRSLLNPDCTVLEFASGMSTLWFARRCRRVVSIEIDPAWHAEVVRRLARLAKRRLPPDATPSTVRRYSAVSHYFAVNRDEVPRQSSSVEVSHRRSSACDTQLRSQISVDYNSLNVFS